ncbi:MAG: CPBP family intramembrane metalloprotease [Peptococcaceae bacterium]|nr:CPBP family intramembrane metalloprotease [Peptococcaceae bacterium]
MKENNLKTLDFFVIFFGSACLTVFIKRALLSIVPELYATSTGNIIGSLWVQDGLFFLGVLLFLRLHGERLSILGWRLPKSATTVLGAVASGALLYLLMNMTALALNRLLPHGLAQQSVASYMQAGDGLAQKLVVWLTMGVLAPIVEETLFRGYLYQSIRNWLPTLPAMFLASLIFGATHMDVQRAIPLALGGFCLNLIAERQQSVLVSAISHATWNTLMIIAYYVAIQ